MGARLMVEIVSSVAEGQNVQLLAKVEQNQQRLIEEKLCVQINHSNVLEDVIEGVFEGYRGTDA